MIADKDNISGSKTSIHDFHLYLVSDATGTTLQGLARAALSQFDGINPTERFWPMIRSEMQLDRAITDIKKHPGPVLFTFVDKTLRRKLQAACAELDIPCMPVLDPILRTMSSYLGLQSKGVPGLQHSYFLHIYMPAEYNLMLYHNPAYKIEFVRKYLKKNY